MRINLFVASVVRIAAVAAHLVVQVSSDIRFGVRIEWQHRHTPCWHSPTSLVRRLMAPVRYAVGGAVDPRTFFTCDGDDRGRRRRDLDRVARRRRRTLANLRRRQAGMLLRALGGSADEVEAALTRDWQIYGGEDIVDLIEDYLYLRMRQRDPRVGERIDIYPWVCDISGVWVATPAPVRHSLRRRSAHQRRLEAASTRRPRRGVRPAPEAQPA